MTEERKLLLEVAEYIADTKSHAWPYVESGQQFTDMANLAKRILALLATEPEPVEPCCQEWHTCMKRCVPLAENWRMDAKRLERQLAEAQRDAAVGAVIEKAARDLPEYYELEITIECGAASVYLRNPDGETSCIDRDSDNRLAAEINAAIDAAIQEQKK